jgi:hypothetical protein
MRRQLKHVLLVPIALLAAAALVGVAAAAKPFSPTSIGSSLVKAKVVDGTTLTIKVKGLAAAVRYDESCSFVSATGQGINLGSSGPISNANGKATFSTELALLEHGLPLPGSVTCWIRAAGSDFDADAVSLPDGGTATISGTLRGDPA